MLKNKDELVGLRYALPSPILARSARSQMVASLPKFY